ncbi:hypothetical protein FHS52_000160 [Erythromicrobium ramosum]|uniref:DUF4175 domain-containing protein n=1 Tax=Erythrobacter ramosus TaxID=35811 RepID=A0A6I4UL41_9SPHN|nr:DUF4175 family protein [Erythrobacter ramosus]MBB3774217.1 hypothetical protein [Erythrobacter ramosus]MXP38125.1 DUF4175 domain-containing protein [Erythrobacter ramosus]
MSRELNPNHWVAPARQRAAINAVLVWSPVVLVLAGLCWRLGGIGLAAAVLALGGLALGLAARHLASRFDQGWLVRRLNAREARLEDSAGLVFAAADLAPLEQLQAERIAARIEAIDPETLADGWSQRPIIAAWLLGAVALAAIILWPAEASAPPLAAPSQTEAAAPGQPRLTGQRVRIIPPAYTGLPARYAQSLDIRAPMGSRIEWTLAFTPQAKSAALQLVGGQTLPLTLGEEGWSGSLRLDIPSLYHVTAEGNRMSRTAHRLEPITDEPPQVQVIEPASGLVMIQPGQRRWRVVFEASDDYAVDQMAQLTLTTAIGEGENVSFSERSRMVSGTGDPKRRRFVVDLDLAAFGLQPGSDLVAQLTVADTRAPGPQVVRGPGVILRWPGAVPASADGLELMAKQTMPAYFRSQRQVIIDTEALIRERGKLSADDFMVRSDTIGVDQRLLRLRYGQFVGMEAEEAPRRPPLPVAEKDAPAEQAEGEHHDGDGHDHGDAPESPVFGGLGNITAEYGHVHDESEAATLLDPDTRELLKSALDAMWDAELNLRSGQPEKALPFELKALDFIKRVQQASRIYLPRIGSIQPPLDMARRMAGKREGIVAGGASLTPFAIEDAVPATAWRALSSPQAIDLGGLDRWVRTNSARIRDPLAVLAAIDALRGDPASGALREKLRQQLWAVLTRPPAQVRRRHDGGSVGRRYMQGLR